jgi:hypothetical protein
MTPTTKAVKRKINNAKFHFPRASSFRSGRLAATTAAVKNKRLISIPSKVPTKSIRIEKLSAKLKLNNTSRCSKGRKKHAPFLG